MIPVTCIAISCVSLSTSYFLLADRDKLSLEGMTFKLAYKAKYPVNLPVLWSSRVCIHHAHLRRLRHGGLLQCLLHEWPAAESEAYHSNLRCGYVRRCGDFSYRRRKPPGSGLCLLLHIAEALSTFGSMFAVFCGSGYLPYTAAIFFNTVPKLERYIEVLSLRRRRQSRRCKGQQAAGRGGAVHSIPMNLPSDMSDRFIFLLMI